MTQAEITEKCLEYISNRYGHIVDEYYLMMEVAVMSDFERFSKLNLDMSSSINPPLKVDADKEIKSVSIRSFSSGATRNSDVDKLDYEGFLHPDVLHRFAQYMHKHRKLEDGSLRASDNWQKGIPTEELMKSKLRHVFDVWTFHRNRFFGFDMEEALCGVLFNTLAYLHYLVVLRKPTSK
jgi:hypothetical protein